MGQSEKKQFSTGAGYNPDIFRKWHKYKNTFSKLAEIYIAKYLCAKSLLFMRPKRLTFIGKHSPSKLPATSHRCHRAAT